MCVDPDPDPARTDPFTSIEYLNPPSKTSRHPPLSRPRQGINKGVDIFECVQSKVDIDRLLGINAFSLDKLLTEDPEFLVRNRFFESFLLRLRSDCPYGSLVMGRKVNIVMRPIYRYVYFKPENPSPCFYVLY